jgi:hypothetical protein
MVYKLVYSRKTDIARLAQIPNRVYSSAVFDPDYQMAPENRHRRPSSLPADPAAGRPYSPPL